jgi:acetylornithine aminotransferase
VPIGALVTFGPEVAGLLAPGQHGTTFGGNPLACAAGLAVLDTIAKDGLLEHTTAMGERLAGGVLALDHPLVAGVRGRGLHRALALTADVSAAVADRAHRAGFIVNPVQPDAVRITPPLVISAAQVDDFIAALPALLDGPEAS